MAVTGFLTGSEALAQAGGLSATYFRTIITQILALERQPLERLQSELDTVQVRRTLYTETQTKFSELTSLALSLNASYTGNIFGARSVTVTDNNPNAEVMTASASSGAGIGTYEVSITALAAAHRVASAEQSSTSSALNLSGTFYIGGESAHSASGTAQGAVSAFGMASVSGSNRELGTDRYFVEFRKNGANFEFRLVNSDGEAVAISSTSDGTGSLTSDWQVVTEGTTWDTGRGLTITFTSSAFNEATMAASMPTDITSPGTTIAYVDYTPQGAAITVTTSDSLESIRDAINAATFPEGSEVQATIVGNRLILTAQHSGTYRQIKFSDPDGILNSLGFLSAGAWNTTNPGYQAAANADFTVNGIAFKRSSNTVSTVVSGVTFTLKQAGGTATATVTADASAVVNKLTEFLNKFNEIQDFLKTNTATTYDSQNQTYTRGGLAGDASFITLRGDLVSRMLATVSGQPEGYATLRDIGITISDDDSFHFSITDQATLESKLASNYQAVQTLISEIVKTIYDESGGTTSGLLAPYVDSLDGVLALNIEAADDQIDALNDSIGAMEERLAQREQQLVTEFGRLFGQLSLLRAQQAYASSIFGLSLLG